EGQQEGAGEEADARAGRVRQRVQGRALVKGVASSTQRPCCASGSVLMKKGLVIAAALLAAPLFARAADAEPGKVIVGLYHAAPGKQLELLKWLAARDAVDKEAGVAATQIYAHTDGDSWDYLVIAPQLTDAEGAKVDE